MTTTAPHTTEALPQLKDRASFFRPAQRAARNLTDCARQKARSMTAAEQLVPVATESLSWTEICARYPDQFVCLVEIMRVDRQSPEIKAARVIGHSDA